MGAHTTGRLIRAIAAAGAALALAGCMEQNWARRETLQLTSGDAIASNIAVQTVDPWSSGAFDKTIEYDGIRMGNAVDLYREPRPKPADQPLSGQAINTVGLTTD